MLRHETRHAHASMGGATARKMPRMHSRALVKPHEEWHLRAFECRVRRSRILGDIHVALHHFPVRAHVFAIKIRLVVLVLLDHPEIALGSVEPLLSAGDRGYSDQISALIKI